MSRDLNISNAKGVALLEFAVTVPLMVLLLAGLFDFARLSIEQTFVRDTVQSAGRFGASQSSECLGQAVAKLKSDLGSGLFTKHLDYNIDRSIIFTNTDGVSGILLDVKVSTSCFYCSLAGPQTEGALSGYTFNSTAFFTVESSNCSGGVHSY
ncbi:MAG: pilus assembly protein [Bdellovibrionales bacterium]|nr:pilus assembly protein [Bdellovibrionales bacterium]